MNSVPNHSENTQRILGYISYLRDISRKIISRNGFEKCLLNKSLGYATQFHNFNPEIFPGDSYYEELSNYYNFLQKNHDKKLFIGIGLIAGTRKRIFAAPLFIIQCQLLKEQNTNTLSIAPDIETLNLNYDFISALSTSYFNEEDDILNPLTEEENRVVEEIETFIKNMENFELSELSRLGLEAFDKLKYKISHFKDIERFPEEQYNFKKEITKYTTRPTRRNTGNLNEDNGNISRNKSLFEGELQHVNANHFFISTIPDQLSTYEALNSFLLNINDEHDFKNPVVEKLLVNALTENEAEIEREPIEDEIQIIIDKFLPTSLSDMQMKGIKNAWANEISYIQGPPGTGKSHTISALILSAIALNKKVLIVSQKTAALNVVNQKTEPLISESDGIIGVCYYDKDARRKIRTYCNTLRTLTSNNAFFSKVQSLKNVMLELEAKLNYKLEEVRIETQKLESELKKQRHFQTSNKHFQVELNRLSKDFIEIPRGFPFKIIRNTSKYNVATSHLENICVENPHALISKLYIYKFKQHLQKKFFVPQSWLEMTTFPYFSKAFVNLNVLYSENQKLLRTLNANVNNIRNSIKNLKKDNKGIQTKLIKIKYKINVFENIKNEDYQKELDQFDRMLINTNSRLINNRMKTINFNKITDIIPFWTAEIRNLGHLFPLQPDLFDLVVVDEASQVNLAEILPVFYRGKKICILGDHNQLSLKASGLNFSLSKNFDELTWEKYNRLLMRYQTGSKKKLTVSQASILDFIKSEEYQTGIREIMLDEHFRSLPHLAKYTSKNFYKDPENPDGKLKVMTETPEKMSINCFKAIRVNGIRERNFKGETTNKAVLAEAEEVVKIIVGLIELKNQTLFNSEYSPPSHINPINFSIGVISMIRDQCELIKELLKLRFPNNELTNYGIDLENNEGIGTPEEFQGNERDIIIFTLCLDSKCVSGQGHYQDAKRLNVATSRAKSFTYFVYSPFPKTFDKIYNYLNYIKGGVSEEDIFSSNEEPLKLELPPLNHSLFDSDFERYVYSYLNTFVKEKAGTNKLTIHNQIKSCGQKKLDFVIYNHENQKSVAIEVDGSQHFENNNLNSSYTIEHVERMNILLRAGWNIINTPYHKWYKDGWLSEENNPNFKNEIDRIFNEISFYIF